MSGLRERIADGRTDLVFVAIPSGVPADAADGSGVSLLQWCAYYGDVSAMRFLLSHGADLASLGPNLDLNGAAFHGHWRLCQFLIEQGADVNHALPGTRETPLHAAASRANRPEHLHVFRVLLASGADPRCVTARGMETGSFMRDARTRGETPLHRAAAFGSAESIRLLLDAGAALDARDMNGDSPLAWASWHRRPAHILALLCYDGHAIHPEAVRRATADGGTGDAMALHLLGTPHPAGGDT